MAPKEVKEGKSGDRCSRAQESVVCAVGGDELKATKMVTILVTLLMAFGLVLFGCAPEAAPPAEEDGEAPSEEEEEEAPSAPEMEMFEWRIACDHPTTKGQFYAHEPMMADIEAMSGGQLKISYYPAGEICSPAEVFDFVSSGAAEGGIRWPGYDAGKNTAFDLFANMMTYMGAREYLQWFNFGGGNEVARDIYSKYGLHFIPVGCYPAESGIRTTKAQIKTIDDYDGLQLRISSRIAGRIVEQLGGSPVSVAHAETYEALSRGTIDGGEMGNFTDDWAAGYQEVCPYVSTPAWYQISAPMVLIVNEDVWNDLPDHLQDIVNVACQSAQSYATGLMEHENYEHLQLWLDAGLTINKLPEEDLDRIQTMAADIFKEEADANADFGTVLDSIVAYGKLATAYNEDVYGRYRQGVGRPVEWP